MIELPPSEFVYGRYGLSNLPWAVIRTTEVYVKHLLAQNIIGYCDGALIEIRPRPDDMAVMFEDDGFEYWVHVPKDVWKVYMHAERQQ